MYKSYTLFGINKIRNNWYKDLHFQLYGYKTVIWIACIRECTQKFPDWPPGARTAMVQLSATRCSCIAILWVSIVSFDAITLCVAYQRAFIVFVVHFVIGSVRKLLDTPSYTNKFSVSVPVIGPRTSSENSVGYMLFTTADFKPFNS
jgi:hypothetical protein